MADVRALGAFEVRLDGAVADLGGPRRRSVLARLVAAHGAMVPAGRLVEELWPEQAPPRAAGGLQAYVSHLRRALEPARPPRTPARVLVTAPPGYALRLPEDAVDVWRFDALVDRASERLEAADPAGARACAEEALAQWRGPAYAEFADLPWAATEAGRLDERRRTAVEHRAEAMLRLGAAAEAVPGLEAHAAAEPLREEAWRLLALALYRAGRQGDALSALRRARSVLAEELGVDPGPVLRALEADILAQAPRLEDGPPRAARLAPRVAREGDPVPAVPEEPLFVGRRDELERLAAAAAQAAEGRCGLVLVGGDAGMGKTSLVRRIAGTLAAGGWTAAWGRAAETGGAPAAWPWAELLRELAAAEPPPAGLAGPLAPLLSDAADAPASDITSARFRLHRAAGDYLAGLAGRAPLLLVLDDLHWADEETLALLAGLPARLADRPVLLVGTFRQTEAPERLTGTLAALARYEPVRVELAGLPAADVAALVRASCAAEVGPGELAAIAERTGGNPFFTRETARLLDTDGPAAATRLVPAGVGDVLRHRITRLPETALPILRYAAVVGRDADLGLLTDVSGGDEDAVIDAVDAGLAAGLLTEPGPGRIAFAHALVRDTFLAGLSRARRTRLHGRVAEAMERRRPDDVAAIAHHHLAAGSPDPDRAVRYARLAAEAAEARFAHRAAAELWAGAAAAVRDRRDGRWLELEAAAIRAGALAGEVVEARDRRREVLGPARAHGDARLLARVIVGFDVPTLWTSRQYGTVDPEVIEAVREALAGLGDDDPELRVRLLTSLAIELEGEPDDEGVRAADEAVRTARALDRPDLLAVALNGRYLNGYRFAGAHEDRYRAAAEMLDVATAHDLGLYRVLAHLQLQHVCVARLDLAAARRHHEEGLRLAGQYGLPLLSMIAGWYEALEHALAARFEEAEAAYGRVSAAIGHARIWSSERAMEMLGVFCQRMLQGREGEMTDAARWLWERWRHVGATADLYALALAGAGRTAEARRVVEGAGPIRRDYFFDLVMTVRGRRAIALDDPGTAGEAYEALLPYRDHLAGGGTAVVTLGPVAQTLGDLAAFLGLVGEAAAHYARAGAIAERAGTEYWRAVARESLRALAA